MRNEQEIAVIEKMTSILTKILDAKEKENITDENAKIALTDIFKLLNMSVDAIQKQKESKTNIFNKYQEIWFKVINKAKKQVKFPLVEINDNLFRVYVMALFKKSGNGDLLKQATGWDSANLIKEKVTPDMKVLLLSVINFDEQINNKE